MRIRLKGILTEQQQERGYHLFETEDVVELWRNDSCIAVFSSGGVTANRLRKEADKDWERRSPAGFKIRGSGKSYTALTT